MMEDNWLIIWERLPTTNKLLRLALFSHLSSEPARPGSRGYWARDISPHCCHRDRIREKKISVHRATHCHWSSENYTRKYIYLILLHFQHYVWIRSLFADFVNLNFYTNPITHSFPPEALTGTHPSHHCCKKLVNNNIAKILANVI